MPTVFQTMQAIGALAMLVGGLAGLFFRKRVASRVDTEALTAKRMQALIACHNFPLISAIGILLVGIGWSTNIVCELLSLSELAQAAESLSVLTFPLALLCFAFRTRRINRLVEEYHGWLCPRCLYPVAGVSKGTTRCPECGDRFDVETAVSCWWGDPPPEESEEGAER